MNDTRILEFEERLNQLEEINLSLRGKNSLLRLFSVGFLVLGSILLGAWQAERAEPQEVSQVVKSRKFLVIDGDGNEVGEFSSTEKGPSLKLIGDKESIEIELSAPADGPRLKMYDRERDSVAYLGVEETARLTLGHQGFSSSANMAADPLGGRITVRNKKGNSETTLQAADYGPVLSLNYPGRIGRIYLMVYKNNPSLLLQDEPAEAKINLLLEEGVPKLRMVDKEGE